jgi:PTH1 family peptidyl-tRNA hydrolase
MKIIVGLGNPGDQYIMTRHNVGFMVVDVIAAAHHIVFKKKFQALWTETTLNGESIFLIKPQTFMNLSGDSLIQFLSFYKWKSENLIVCHDELDLKFGDIRIKNGGGLAGHNGLKSIATHIGQDFKRLRIGIGRSQTQQEVSSYVLSPFSKDEQNDLPDVLRKAVELIVNF